MVHVPDRNTWPVVRRVELVLAFLRTVPSIPRAGRWLLFRVAPCGWDSAGHVPVCRISQGREAVTHRVGHITGGIESVRDRPPSRDGDSFFLHGNSLVIGVLIPSAAVFWLNHHEKNHQSGNA